MKLDEMKKIDITKYVFPYYKFNNERWVRLSDVDKFKTYLLGQLDLEKSNETRKTKVSSKETKAKSAGEVHFTKPS